MTLMSDYSLTGAEARRAVEQGLADAEWFIPDIDSSRLHELSTRSNTRAALDLALWLALLIGIGVVAYLSLGSWWAVPAFAVYGALYGGAADPRWHECGHGTAFKAPWANNLVYYVASFMLLREPTMWRWSHFRHHSDTIIVGRDPEIVFQRPYRLRTAIPNYLHIFNGPAMIWRMIRHAFGSIDDDARDFVPETDLRRVVWEARAFVLILSGVVVWALAIGSVVPLLFIGLPSFYGVWLVWFFAITQHAGLRENVLDHRLNSRTVYMNPVFRFLYLNMNYHVEHHMFPSVPYHALPALHSEVKGQLAPPAPSMAAAYREIFTALRHQRSDPTWELDGRRISGCVGDVPDTDVPLSGILVAGGADVGPADELKPAQHKRVDIGERTFVLCRLDRDRFVLADGLCTHGRTHLADGVLIDGVIECPKHNGRFDIATGAPLCRPVQIPLAVYPVSVANGRLVAQLDEGEIQ